MGRTEGSTHVVPQQWKHPEREGCMGINLKHKSTAPLGAVVKFMAPGTRLSLKQAGADNTVAHNSLAQFGVGSVYSGSLKAILHLSWFPLVERRGKNDYGILDFVLSS